MSRGIVRKARTFVVVLGVASVAIACGSSSESPSATPASTAGLQSPSPSARPSPSVTPSPSPTETAAASLGPTPAPAPEATPPEPGQAWNGLAVTAASPVRRASTAYRQVEWQGQTYGFVTLLDAAGSSKFEIARKQPDGFWVPILPDIPDSRGGLLAAGDSVLVAMQDQGRTLDCATGTDGFEHCATDTIKVWTSKDGTHWDPAGTLPGSANVWIDYLACGPAGFVAGGSSSVLWLSKDGSSWRKVALPASTFKGAILDGIWAVPGGYVLTGGIERIPQEPGYMGTLGGSVVAWWSKDAQHWTRSSIGVPAGGAQVMGPIYTLDDGLFASGYVYTDGDYGAGYVTAAWTSTDGGRTWRYHAVDTTVDVRQSFFPSIPVPNGSLLVGDGHRLISVTERSSSTVVGGIYETLDGTIWHILDIQGLDYLNAIVGTDWYSVDVTVDETGLVFTVPVEGGVVDVRAVALAALP
jgi:hypothetical protein